MSSNNDPETEKLLDYDGALKRLGGDHELFKEFVSIFFEDAPAMLKEIENGLSNSDSKWVEKWAHSLKGLIANFGAKDCVRLTSKIESDARGVEISKSAEDFEKLKVLFQNLCGELEEFHQ